MSTLLNYLTEAGQRLEAFGMPSLWNIFWALLVFLVGRWLAKRSRIWFRRAQSRLDMTLSESVVDVAESVIYYGIVVAAGFLSLSLLGIPVQSLLLILAIFLALAAIFLQPALNNLAATIIFVVFQTYKQGDWIETLGTYGQVNGLQMFSTVLTTIEKSIVTIPNGEMLKNKITNYSQLGYRRADMTFSISYKDDLLAAKKLLQEVLAGEELVLDEPPPIIGVQDLGENGVLFSVWPFVDMPDYFAAKLAIAEQVKLRFDEAGITIPFPQRDVHVSPQSIAQSLKP